jgi:endoglucanase
MPDDSSRRFQCAMTYQPDWSQCLMKLPVIPIAIAGLAVIILAAFLVTRHNSQPATSDTPELKPELAALWQDYRSTSWDGGSGRTIDRSAGDITTSEGQSYTMLRAVWSDDRGTFDKTWQWTQANIRRGDKLFSWKWGQRSDGSWGVLTTEGGENTASDADSDIALALLMAGKRWGDHSYTAAGKQVVRSIWQHDVVTAAGKPYLAADDLENRKTDGPAIINPSYFAPYAYRVFARVDSDHDWRGLAADNYELLLRAMTDKLDGTVTVNLPPDWLRIDLRTGDIGAAAGKSTGFGYDAFRTVWRTTVDYSWNHSSDAAKVLDKLGFLQQQWAAHGRLADGYSHGGEPTGGENTGFYGGTLGYFQFRHPDSAKAVVAGKLAPLYDADTQRLTRSLNYYDNNWAWFGLALYGGQLPDIAGGESS